MGGFLHPLHPILSNYFNRLNVFQERLDTMKDQMDSAAQSRILIISSVKGVTVIVLAGFVRWYLQASKLLASILTTTPLWRQFDPLAVLNLLAKQRQQRLAALHQAETEEDKENEALRSILDANKAQKDNHG
jgi:hypothetical protein